MVISNKILTATLLYGTGCITGSSGGSRTLGTTSTSFNVLIVPNLTS